MKKSIFRFLTVLLVAFAMVAGAASSFAAATIVILNADGAGEGFNDTTPVSPVGGNTGTTLGQQRLIAFQHAADIWGATLSSTQTITIRAQFNPLTCTATSATLGSAGAAFIEFDFPNAPFAGTLYSEALAEKLSNDDLEPTHDINAQFNSNLGQSGCFTGTFFYLGLDNNHGSNTDLVAVLLHEFGHGLGFQTFTSNSTGAQLAGLPAIYDRFLIDISNGKSWLQMTNAERQASAINPRKLAWDGPKVFADVPTVLQFGVPVLVVNTPPGIAGSYDAGTASFGPQPTAGGVTGDLLLANDGAGTVTDGCEAFPAGFFAGKIAVIDRGTCTFKTKTLNAQNANASAVILVNNAAGGPAPSLGDDATITTPITIPTISVTQADGNAIKAQLGSGVNATVKLNTSQRAGADPTGKALLNSPNPVVAGSSVSHWDPIMTPNQLMEPAINADLSHSVTTPQDLTYSEMREIGWEPNPLPNSITITSGNNQSLNINTQFAPLSVATSPAVAGLKVTFTANNSPEGANGTFAGTGDRIAVVDTNAEGAATAPAFTANNKGGTFTVNATVPGAGTAAFTLTSTGPLTLSSAVSRKTHGSIATPFDIPLPLTGNAGIECRTGGASGNYTLVFSFPNPVVSGTAAVTTGTGMVSGNPVFSGRTMTVNLTGVTDVQFLTVTLTNVTDSSSQVLPSAAVNMKVLQGDTNGESTSTVDSGDSTQTRSRSGLAVDATTFRSDVNADGFINSGDSTIVRGRAGNTVGNPTIARARR